MLPDVSSSDSGKSQNIPPRSHSLANIGKRNLDPIRESTQDVERARTLLNNYTKDNNLHDGGAKTDDEEHRYPLEELLHSFAHMIGWVEKLTSLLQNAYDSQLESETAMMLAESNLQMALANNEMLEDALRQAGPNVKDIGWRRLSERERLRQLTKEEEELENSSEESSSPVYKSQSSPPPQIHPAPLHQQPSSSLRFFNFPSLSRSTPLVSSHSSQPSGRAESPTGTQSASHSHPHSRPSSPALSRPTPREKELTMLLEKEKEAFKSVAEAKLALENELETLSQALFEEANKMVSTSNRKLAETEEELRIVMEEREALRGALRIVEGENGLLRGKTSNQIIAADDELEVSVEDKGETIEQHEVSANYLNLDEPYSLADRVSFIAISPVDSGGHPDLWYADASLDTKSSGSHSPSDSPHLPPPTLHPLDVIPSPTDDSHSQKEDTRSASPLSAVASKPVVRWSVMPQTPRSRIAVKNEFERAMSRMRRLIEDVEGNSHLSLTPSEDISKSEIF